MLLKMDSLVDLASGEAAPKHAFGARAAKLARLAALDLPVPPAVALSFDLVRDLAEGAAPPPLPDMGLVALRSSPEERAWGGAPALLYLGLSDAALPELAARIGAVPALTAYRRFIQSFGVAVAGIDAEAFETLAAQARRRAGLARGQSLDAEGLAELIRAMQTLYEEELGRPFPQCRDVQLAEGLAAMARAWNATSARLLREARGAPAHAGMGLIVQRMMIPTGPDDVAWGQYQDVSSATGAPEISGSVQGIDGRARSLTALSRAAADRLADLSGRIAAAFGDAYQIDFAVEDGQVGILDAQPVRRSARAAVRIAVDLAEAGVISRSDALLRIDPTSLVAHLHPQIDAGQHRDVFARGIGASPGAATGRAVFSAEAAAAAAAQGEAVILIRTETSPEDIRGMHAARGVLTIRGGMTSHAAVIARGLGLPCVVGAGSLRLDVARRQIASADGRVFGEGAIITVDGTRGEAISGAPPLVAPDPGGAFATLMDWADRTRDMGVRANADTPQDARVARDFRVDGIGLCRTEHMFFAEGRITVMREMILASTEADRARALERLLPMQRADFEALFQIMRGLPVTIRLLDPPLHEFLPHGAEDMAELAEAMGIEPAQVMTRAAELAEFNPMLGKRGVRLGIVMPEIYDMQARAIFEAAVAVNADPGDPVVPEIMIPLVSANREVELVETRVRAVAAAVQAETGMRPDYRLGVMVETPRAALRAGDIARHSAFLSFGTNDLTQMTYGLSRDDAGRFMHDYVQKGVFPEDPFHSLDLDGVGELLLIAAERGRTTRPDIVLGLCGEHGGDPASVRFCRMAGFDYVSCSPFRVPVARLAAAQAALLARPASGDPAQ